LRTIHQALTLVAVFSVSACSGIGSSTSPLPAGSSTQPNPQTQSRVLQKHVKAGNGSYVLFGDAMLVHPGYNSPTAAQATTTGPNAFGGVDFSFPAGLTVNQLNNLATEYMFTTGTCGLGSPRFSVTVNSASGPSIFFYLGPPPNYNTCPPNVWTNSGNLASPTNLVDATQLGGAFYEPYATVQATYGNDVIYDIALVMDGPSQTAEFDNTQVNNATFTYENADSCKDGGWKQFTSTPGPFKNQGDCVSYFNNGK